MIRCWRKRADDDDTEKGYTKMNEKLLAVLTVIVFYHIVQADETKLNVKVGDHGLVSYQQLPMRTPAGGADFQGSAFIHPLRTPAGFLVTELQPSDHLHHFGLWWPWKFVEVDGRKILCWELQRKDGLIEARGAELTGTGFRANNVYIDRKASEGPRVIINERLDVEVSAVVDAPVRGYYLDIEIVQKPAAGKEITVSTYRYSGFALRATAQWNKGNSSVLTSAGRNYSESNFTRARWVRVEGSGQPGQKAGILLMSHPDNRDHPEMLRTWNPETHNGAVFINFNTVYEKPWKMRAGQSYARNYRLFVYDGELTSDTAEELWRKYGN
jgi:hypothetical protein